MNYVDICPPAVVAQIQAADLRQSAASDLFSWVEERVDRPCMLATIEAIAARMGPEADLSVVNIFCNTVATYARKLDMAQKGVIQAAYLRMPHDPSISFNYFLALRLTGIDIRDDLRGRIRSDWSFAGPRDAAQTWDYFLYLASLEETGALEALADKIARTESGNDVVLLLESLAELPGPGVEAVISDYLNDPRSTDGVEGPGMSVGKNAELLLTMRKL